MNSNGQQNVHSFIDEYIKYLYRSVADPDLFFINIGSEPEFLKTSESESASGPWNPDLTKKGESGSDQERSGSDDIRHTCIHCKKKLIFDDFFAQNFT